MLRKNPWIASWRPMPAARLRLFCFPFAGGGASAYREWPEALPPAVDVCPIQLPGREYRLREPAFSQLPPLVSMVSTVLQPYLDLPYALLGHSMGALISFELARQLRREHLPEPVHLVLSGWRAAHLPANQAPISRLPEAEFLRELHRLHGTPEAVFQSRELLELFVPTLRTDFALVETYAYFAEDPLACSISVLGGLQDYSVSEEDLAAWREHTTGTVKLRMFPGDHFFFFAGVNRARVLQAVQHDLQPFFDASRATIGGRA